jgi:hypothetical protein
MFSPKNLAAPAALLVGALGGRLGPIHFPVL